MEEAKVSVVIPVYDVEKYIKKCVNSIVNQTYKNLEIIIIDDGSTDNSAKICDELGHRDKRIKVIHKKNEGLGLTRDKGICEATGKYIYFIDSDDYINRNTIERCVELAEKNNLQIVTFGAESIDNNGKIISETIPSSNSQIYAGEDIKNKIFPIILGNNEVKFDGISNLIGSAWASFYLLDFIRKIDWKFVSERIYLSEDVFSFLSLYNYVTRIGIISETFYYYRKNEKSLTHVYVKDKFNRNNKFLIEGLKICEKNNYNTEIIVGLKKYYIANTFGILKSLIASSMSKEEKEDELKKIVNDKILQNLLKSYNLRSEKGRRKIFLLMLKKKRLFIIKLMLEFKIRGEKKD